MFLLQNSLTVSAQLMAVALSKILKSLQACFVGKAEHVKDLVVVAQLLTECLHAKEEQIQRCIQKLFKHLQKTYFVAPLRSKASGKKQNLEEARAIVELLILIPRNYFSSLDISKFLAFALATEAMTQQSPTAEDPVSARFNLLLSCRKALKSCAQKYSQVFCEVGVGPTAVDRRRWYL
jgi:hypothetical protein